MFKCSNCGKESDYLRHWAKEECIYNFYVNDGEPDYHLKDRVPCHEEGEWGCPECVHVVAHSEDEAIAVLTGSG